MYDRKHPQKPWLIAGAQLNFVPVVDVEDEFGDKVLHLWSREPQSMTLTREVIPKTKTLNALIQAADISPLLEQIGHETRLSQGYQEIASGKATCLYSANCRYDQKEPGVESFVYDKGVWTPTEIYKIDVGGRAYMLCKFPIAFDGMKLPAFDDGWRDDTRMYVNMHFVVCAIPPENTKECDVAVRALCEQLHASEAYPPLSVWWTSIMNSMFYNRSRMSYLTGSAAVKYPYDYEHLRRIQMPNGIRLDENESFSTLFRRLASLAPDNRLVANYAEWIDALPDEDRQVVEEKIIKPWIRRINQSQRKYPVLTQDVPSGVTPLTREEIVQFTQQKNTIRVIFREILRGFVGEQVVNWHADHVPDFAVKDRIMPEGIGNYLTHYTLNKFGNLKERGSVFFQSLIADLNNLGVMVVGRKDRKVVQDVMETFFESTFTEECTSFIKTVFESPPDDLYASIQQLKHRLFSKLVDSVASKVSEGRLDLQGGNVQAVIFRLQHYLLKRRVAEKFGQL